MEHVKVMSTHLTMPICFSELNITKSNKEKEYMSRISYASIVGSLIYVMVCINAKPYPNS